MFSVSSEWTYIHLRSQWRVISRPVAIWSQCLSHDVKHTLRLLSLAWNLALGQQENGTWSRESMYQIIYGYICYGRSWMPPAVWTMHEAPFTCDDISHHFVGRFKWPFNILRPRQNGRHFADDVLKLIFLNENIWIPIKISLKFVPKGSINNIPALVQIMAWLGAVRATSHYLSQWWLIYGGIYASLVLNGNIYEITNDQEN